jgi:hypothetical protein
MKKLFENIGGNQFKLVKESDWQTTQEHNGNINKGRRMLRAQAQYITAAGASPHADDEVKSTCQQALKDIKTLDEIISKGYLDSGYQYDDDDPRNKLDQMDDKYFDREKARTGSSKEEEIEAEIRHTIARRHLDEHMNSYRQYFSRELAEVLFPDPGDEFHDFSLNDYLDDIAYHEQDDRGDDDHGL